MPRETSKNETSMRLLYVGFEEVVRYTVLRFINELILVVNVSEILCSTTEGISTPCYNIYIFIIYIYIYILLVCILPFKFQAGLCILKFFWINRSTH